MRRHLLILFTILLVCAAPAHAATVFLLPTSPVYDIAPGDIVTADIVLNFPDAASLAFGVNIYFSDNLEFVSYTDGGLGDPNFTRDPDFVAPGVLEAAGTAAFEGLPQFGVVASLEFRYRYRANGFIELGETNFLSGPPWISAEDFITIIPVELNRLDYPVPLPSALWLFASAVVSRWALARGSRGFRGCRKT